VVGLVAGSCRQAPGQLEISTGNGESRKIDDVLDRRRLAVWWTVRNMSYLVNTPSKKAQRSHDTRTASGARNEATAAAGALRYFQTRHRNSDTPLDDVEGN